MKYFLSFFSRLSFSPPLSFRATTRNPSLLSVIPAKAGIHFLILLSLCFPAFSQHQTVAEAMGHNPIGSVSEAVNYYDMALRAKTLEEKERLYNLIIDFYLNTKEEYPDRLFTETYVSYATELMDLEEGEKALLLVDRITPVLKIEDKYLSDSIKADLFIQNKQDWHNAKLICEDLRRSKSKIPVGFSSGAMIEVLENNYKNAFDLLEASPRRDGEMNSLASYCALKTGDLEKCIHYADQVIRLPRDRNNYSLPYLTRGAALLKQGKTAEAQKFLALGRKLDKWNFSELSNRNDALLRTQIEKDISDIESQFSEQKK